jgi:hypothetical protein
MERHARENANGSRQVEHAELSVHGVSRARLDDLPEVLTAAEVVAYLRGIFGRNAVYDLLNCQLIRNRRHGQKFLIPRAALRDFIDCRDEDAGARTPR